MPNNLSVETIELLEEFADWLHLNGYIDSDYYAEEPKAIDEFVKQKNDGKLQT